MTHEDASSPAASSLARPVSGANLPDGMQRAAAFAPINIALSKYW